MKILMVTSEAVPYIQTGGLGDVAGTLSKELAAHGHDVFLVLPFYRQIRQNRFKLDLHAAKSKLTVQMGDSELDCKIWESPRSGNLRVFFIEYQQFFDRNTIYDDGREGYKDNSSRFAFLSKAALDLAVKIRLKPDIVHLNDWPTALAAYYLKTWYWNNPFLKEAASVLTIHNMGYQGQFDASANKFIGLNWMQMRSDEFEDHGGINFLKGGIFYADKVTTVSPTYAREILTEPGGCGLSSYLLRRKDDVKGILNGIDEEEWNCRSDKLIPQTYSADNLEGKKAAKKELQERFKLTIDETLPVFGVVSRMAYQKGLHLLLECADEILSWNLQLVVLGSGDPDIAAQFSTLSKRYPNKVGTYIGFQAELAHLIEAGSDFFIMPSLYEPCGLNQIYSMLYGTLPIVRSTGGLADTVKNFDEKSETGTGFVFQDSDGAALKNTIGWALSTWYNRKASYNAMQKRAMNQDFSWSRAVTAYEDTYLQAKERHQNWH